MSRILVLGGTGMLGAPAVRRFLDDGFEVRVFARDPVRVRACFGRAVDLVAGDVGNVKALERAMEDCPTVHISIGGDVDLESAENVVSLAPSLGTRRIGYVSGTTVCEENAWFPMVAAKLAAERTVQECGVPWTIFRPTWPMEQLPNFVRLGRPIMIGSLPTPYHFFAADDMARMLSVAYSEEATVERCLYIHGPEPVMVKDAVRRYARALDLSTDEPMVMSLFKARLVGLFTGNRKLRAAADLMAYFEKVGEPGDPMEANELLGAPTTTLDTWLLERVEGATVG